MGVTQSTTLNDDTEGIATGSVYGDRGDGTSEWHQFAKIRDVDAKGILKLEDAAHASGDAGVFVLGVRNDARASFGADLDYSPIAVTPAGAGYAALIPEATSAWALSNAQAFAVTNLVIKGTAGKLFKLFAQNDNAAARYIQLHNAAALPADTAVPIFSIKLAIGEGREIDFTQFGRYFSTGIVVCNSTTSATKTIGAADSNFTALYL